MTRGFVFSRLLILGLTVSLTMASATQGGEFSAELRGEDGTLNLVGEAGFMELPSMYSVYLQAKEGRCAIHLSGFREAPTEGTYVVESSDSLRIRALCVLESAEPRERLLAERGQLTITGRTPVRLDGVFDFTLVGGITGKELRLDGSFSSSLTSEI